MSILARRIIALMVFALVTIGLVSALALQGQLGGAHKQSPPALDRKLGAPLVLSDADLKAAIEALMELEACKDLDIVVADPGEGDRKVTLRIGPDKTVREALEMLASVYNREFSVEKGVAHLNRKEHSVRAASPNRLYELLPGIRPDDSGGVRLSIPGEKPIADALRETAKALRESAREREKQGGDWPLMADELRKSAERLEDLAKELESKARVRGDDKVERRELRIREPEVRVFEWRKDLTPEKEEKMREWLRERGYLKDRPSDSAPRIRERLELQLPRIRDLFKDMPDFDELLKDAPALKDRTFVYRTGDLSALMESITDEQWRLHEKQGYLRISDLTERQRRLLGVRTDGDAKISITLVLGDKRLNIRSE